MEKDNRNKVEKVFCADLFAGAGGLTLAAKNVGLNVKLAIEINNHACQTYKDNLVKRNKNLHLYQNDILELSPHKLYKKHFEKDGGCDLVLGGPPCQGFSVHRIKNAGVDDPRNGLIFRYFEFVSVFNPKAFLMENVPGILWPRHKNYLKEFYNAGENAGYIIKEPIVLDARDYGVPQRRRRVFILGVKKGIEYKSKWPPPKTHGNEKARIKNPNLKLWMNAGTIFSKPLADADENNRHMNHSPELIEVFTSTPINGGSRAQSNRVLKCHKKHNGHKDVYGRINPSMPGPTMTTACINPSKGRFLHPTEHHGITIRHAARFQTFPDWFIFKGGLIAAGEQIGNAVPIKLGEILLRSIVKGIQNSHNRA
jgi:DNA (cytosine-5)-methyltransferase 1